MPKSGAKARRRLTRRFNDFHQRAEPDDRFEEARRLKQIQQRRTAYSVQKATNKMINTTNEELRQNQEEKDGKTQADGTKAESLNEKVQKALQPSDLPTGTHTAASLDAHREKQERQHEKQKANVPTGDLLDTKKKANTAVNTAKADSGPSTLPGVPYQAPPKAIRS